MNQTDLEFIKNLKEKQDIKYVYLSLSIIYRYTGVTASRDGYFKVKNLIDDLKSYMHKVFGLDQLQFDGLWNIFHQDVQNYEIDIFEDLSNNKIGEDIFIECKDLILSEIKRRVKKSTVTEKRAIFLYFDFFYVDYYLYNITSEFDDIYNLIYNEHLDCKLEDILIKTGLIFQSTWVTSKGKDKGLTTYFPSYNDEIIPIIMLMLKGIKYPNFSKAVKSFQKRFNYEKDFNNVFEYIGVDYLIKNNKNPGDFLNFIKVNGEKYFKEHLNIVKTNQINPVIEVELKSNLIDVKKFLFKKFKWLEESIKNISSMCFLRDETEIDKEFSCEINNEQYYICINSWYHESVITKTNTIQILLYHPNFNTVRENLYDPDKMRGLIAFGEDKEVFSIGDDIFFNIFDEVLQDIQKRNFSVLKKELSSDEFNDIHTPIPDFEHYDIDQIVSLIEHIEERFNGLESILQRKLGNNYQKIKFLIKDYKDKKITTKELLRDGGKVIGKNLFRIFSFFLAIK